MASYAPPTISASGLSIPTFQAIFNFFIGQYVATYGAATYIGPDSPDVVDISIRSLAAYQTNQALQSVYLSLNPQTAIGTSLDLCGVLIGTQRRQATSSTCLVTISGSAGAIINNGVIRDTNGNQWNLPAVVTIGSGGTVIVTATAQTTGNITANVGAIQFIATPTAGWTGVSNAGAASPGESVEPDSQYRARLLVAQAKPSVTLLTGTAAAVAAVPGVTRSVVYENPYSFTAGYGLVSTSGTTVTLVIGYPFDASDDLNPITINGVVYSVAASGVTSTTTLTLTTSAGTQTGVPYSIGGGGTLGTPHSITAVVEGGSSAAIAQAIYANSGLGCATLGTTTVIVTDPNNPAISMPIQFTVLGYVIVYVVINIHALAGFTSTIQANIATGIVNYLNGLGIGQNVIFSELYGAALSAQVSAFQPSFSIRAIQDGILAAQTTATLNATTTIVVASAIGIVNGQVVVGTGIPPNTTVTSISGAPSIVISNAATATATGVLVSFFPLTAVDLNVPYQSAAQGEATFVVVNLV
jgi:uncharacterized phage protein gp47/JayE